MHESFRRYRIPLDPSASTAVAALFVDECAQDLARVAIPRPETQLVVRFGPSVRNGLDVYALGVRRRVHRKLIHGGQCTLFARLHLGVHEAVLGVAASDIAGRIVALEDLWGATATQRLLDQLANAHDSVAAALILSRAATERITTSGRPRAHAQLAIDAALKLGSASVNAVACHLGVSERHLRRVFREVAGVSPKTFARLTRFNRALSAASDGGDASWARIAAAVGYYDQAHLIAEFHDIAGVTPRSLLAELRGQIAGAEIAVRPNG